MIKTIETRLGTKFTILTKLVGQNFGVVANVYLPTSENSIHETITFPPGCDERALESAEDWIRKEYESLFR